MDAADKNQQGGICPAIVGPTAVGKTGLILALAKKVPLEVISLDSKQIYHGLRIGTAQPSAEERTICPHHLIDFLSPNEKYSAMRFRQDFERVYNEVRGRGGLPILVGGAGMYLTSLKEGFMEVPGNNPDILKKVRGELELLSDEETRTKLEQVDPQSHAAIHPNDRYRSQRALEIFEISGQPMSLLKAQQVANPSLGLKFPTFVLQRPVDELDGRIIARTELMLKEGWLEETRETMTDFPAHCPGLQSIGYREIVSHLTGKLAREDLVAEIVLVTRQYAKRQRTWFRNIPAEKRCAPDGPHLVDSILDLLIR